MKLKLKLQPSRLREKCRERAEKSSEFGLRFRVEPLVAIVEGEVLERYTVDQASVIIIDKMGVVFI